MNKLHPKTKNEKKFEQWLLQQYGMTNKEQREYTLKGNLESLWEIFSAADMVLFARGLSSIGKELAQLGKKAVDDVAEEAIEKTVKTEVTEEMAENTAKKEMADTAEDLSKEIVKKENVLEDSSGIRAESRTERIYEPSPKHNPQGGWGSENPIPNNEVGQKILDSAYSSSKNKQLYNIYEGDIIKFQPDSSSGKWHAYKVSNTAKEVPIDVYKQMLEQGLITKKDYNKLIKNNWY